MLRNLNNLTTSPMVFFNQIKISLFFLKIDPLNQSVAFVRPVKRTAEKSFFLQAQRLQSAGYVTHPLDRVATPFLCRLLESDMHAGSRRKGNKHFEAKPFPFASDQV